MKKTRRIRVCHCPGCGMITMLQPARVKPDEIPLSVCNYCYRPFENRAVASWLVHPEELEL